MNAVTPATESQPFQPHARFTTLAEDHVIARTKAALEANGFEVFVVDSGEEAKAKILDLIPEGAEVMTNTSKTLDEIGKVYGVTRERIRQIEAKGLDRLSHPGRKRRLQELLGM